MKNKKSGTKKKENKKPKQEEQLPGYPHYPQEEDILSPTVKAERLDIDVENLSRSNKNPVDNFKELPSEPGLTDNTPEIVPGTKADVNKEDLKALGPVDRDMDEGEDETLLPDLKIGPDFSGNDLDIPGSELDDFFEDQGSEDEENNFYSRGQS